MMFITTIWLSIILFPYPVCPLLHSNHTASLCTLSSLLAPTHCIYLFLVGAPSVAPDPESCLVAICRLGALFIFVVVL